MALIFKNKTLIEQPKAQAAVSPSVKNIIPAIQDAATRLLTPAQQVEYFKWSEVKEAPKPLSPIQQKILALQAASKAAKSLQNPASIKALEPKKLMSLKERLDAKKALEASAQLAEEPKEELTSAIKVEEQPVILEEPKEVRILPPEVLSAKEKLLSSIAPKVQDAVIEVFGKYYDLSELAIEIAKLEKTSKILKSSTILAKLQRFQEAQEELKELIDQQEELVAESIAPSPISSTVTEVFNGEAPAEGSYQGAFSLSIELNERQIAARDLAIEGKSFCLIGAAGTGKTTAQRAVAESLLESDRLKECSYKLQGQAGMRVDAPSFVACAFTRRASANLARAIHKNPRLEQVLRHNIMTIHSLLEYEPVIFWDEEKKKDSMRFEPMRTEQNPLTITHLALEEASMIGLDLWEKLYAALPTNVQIIFIGDLNQLPPVFGPSILNYALVQLPIIELTHVYRQAGDSMILANAHNILKGLEVEEGKGFTIIRGKSDVQVGQEKMAIALSKMFEIWYDTGLYQPDEDMILSPFNKQALGTDNMNKWIAQFLGAKRQALVFEVVAGFAKHYLAVGDRVMVNKQDGYITKISANGQYHGQEPQLPGSDLSRFGVRIMGQGSNTDSLDDVLLGYTDFSLESLEETMGERKQQASHLVEILLETGETYCCSAAGDFSPQVFSLGYVLTVHKAQGCEFRKVFIMLHKDHSVMLFRELLYTAVTRAREELCLIAKDWIINKAIKSQRIKGNSLEDKLEYFNSGAVDMLGHIKCTK